MPASALADVVVLEFASGVAGPFVGRLLADLGAQVIKVEPPDGDPFRAEPPLHGGESAFFNYLNAGKLGVVATAVGDSLPFLVAHADIVLHDFHDPLAAQFEAAIRSANAHAVVVSLTPYGRTGERSAWHTSELTEYATSGFGYIAGDPAREPLTLPGHQVAFHAGLHAANAALAALWHARNTAEGQCIEVSRQEAVLSDHAWFVTSWTHQGINQKRAGSLFVPCADGFVFLFNLAPYPNLFILMERFDLLEDESLQVPQNWWARFPEVMAAFAEWAATRTKQEIYHACQELRIAASPVNTMADVAANPQLLARDWFGSVSVGGEQFQSPGVPWKLSGTPFIQPGPAPRLGEHTDVVRSPAFAWANAEVTHGAATPDPASGPLAGLRVIEVTANWAGPAAGRPFADLGADVIKIELATKPATRALAWVNADTAWPQHYNRSGYFNKLNRNKRDICLDLSKPEGKALFLRLVEASDVVVENNAARVMANLGVAYDTLRQANPRIVMCSLSGYGHTGPERNYAAYGSTMETVSGLASILGYGPGEHFGTGSFYADPITGSQAALAALAALHARRRSGKGQWIDVALLEAVTPFFAGPLLEYTVTGVVPGPHGNRSLSSAPQGYYRSAGDDCWLALTVRNDREWPALCNVIGRPDFASDASLATLFGRRSRHDEIDAAITAWSETLDHNHAAKLLQAAGVPAAPAMANWEVLSDNHLNSRGFIIPIRHPEAGTHLFCGFPYRLEKTPARIHRPAPMFAEHNREVFSELLGLDESEIAALYASGVTADEPVYASGPGL
ncbi:MAG: CoA transferase [Dehalococcoidia bacterium]